jgi:SAM-dependent methyltransferase
MRSSRSEPEPSWFETALGVRLPLEGGRIDILGNSFVVRGGILRAETILSESQKQTQQAFGFIWSDRERFAGEEKLDYLAEWYREMYGEVAAASWWSEYGDRPLLLDAGCGAGLSAAGTFRDRLMQVRYLGLDVSTAVEAASERMRARGVDAHFVQASLLDAPLPDASVDVAFAQGVLHHTDSTAAAIAALTRKLRIGGRFLFYVYRKKGPVREFTDDYVRGRLAGMGDKQAWATMMSLTKVGKALGELGVQIEVPEPVELLDIPAGRIDIQRLFYWHVAKAFYDPRLSLDEMNHINLDWYAPAHAHRQTPEQVREWCHAVGLTIEREHLQQSGITVIARKERAL